jgi:hypothetical protein
LLGIANASPVTVGVVELDESEQPPVYCDGLLDRQAMQQSRASDDPHPCVRKATSHADRHGNGCPSAPAMHPGRADLAAALRR